MLEFLLNVSEIMVFVVDRFGNYENRILNFLKKYFKGEVVVMHSIKNSLNECSKKIEFLKNKLKLVE